MTNPASSSLAAILVACAVLLPIPAGAADGEVLINQAAVNAGGITPGDGPGFPVTISQRGKYKLSGILAVPTGVDGIDVTVEDVTIDFNGFTIRSAPAGAAKIGISAFGARLTVMNGTVLGFGRGGIVTDAAFAVIENMRILNGSEVGVLVGNDARVLKSTISKNKFGGIECGARCLIQDNLVTLTLIGNGIRLQQGGVVLGNTIALNDSFGILALSAPVGFGNNSLSNNNGGGAQISNNLVPMHPNACSPACP